MKILVVASGNHGSVAPFVAEQAAALQGVGCEVELFLLHGHGAVGYLRNLRLLRSAIKRFRPTIVHAHYGLCGLLCTMQHAVPVVITFHGSDIAKRSIRWLSRMAAHRAVCNVYVSEQLMHTAQALRSKSVVLPCGVDMHLFVPTDATSARKQLGLDAQQHYVLFAGAYDNSVKNAPLAQQAMQHLPQAQLIELKGFLRTEVPLLMSACDALLLTSHSEGSPQVVKEALAVGLPVVSVNVGDVPQLLASTGGGTTVERNAQSIAAALTPCLDTPHRTEARRLMTALDNRNVALQLLELYKRYANTTAGKAHQYGK